MQRCRYKAVSLKTVRSAESGALSAALGPALGRAQAIADAARASPMATKRDFGERPFTVPPEDCWPSVPLPRSTARDLHQSRTTARLGACVGVRLKESNCAMGSSNLPPDSCNASYPPSRHRPRAPEGYYPCVVPASPGVAIGVRHAKARADEAFVKRNGVVLEW